MTSDEPSRFDRIEVTLQEFIEQWRTDLPFEYEITDRELIITFGSISDIQNTFLRVPGNEELRQFSDLLRGRIVVLKGTPARCNLGVIGVENFTIRF